MHCSNYRTVYFCNIVAESIEEKLRKFSKNFLPASTDLSLVMDFSTDNFKVEGFSFVFENEDEFPNIHDLPLEFRIGIRKLAIKHQIPILAHFSMKKEARIYFIPQTCLG